MKKYLVRVEANNFYDFILDTNDISTMRGGGLTALRLGKPLEEALQKFGTPKKEYSGASQAAAMCEAATTAEEIERHVRSAFRAERKEGEPPVDLLMLNVVVEPIEKDADTTLSVAEQKAVLQQYRRWTVRPVPFDAAARAPDELDKTRPVISKGEKHEETERRQDFGRDNRKFFYNDILSSFFYKQALNEGKQNKSFPHRKTDGSFVSGQFEFIYSFDELNKKPPKGAFGRDLPVSLRNSMAVVYADGNGFGSSMREVGGAAKFDDQLKPLQSALIGSILEWLSQGISNLDPEISKAFAFVAQKPRARFETLLWGGEEMMFVMPAWLVFEFVEKFFEWTNAWKIDGRPLTHAVGVAIAHHKVPIRQMRNVAHDVADAAKDYEENGNNPLRQVNSVTFEIFESLHPPDDDLGAYRAGVYGTDPDDLPKPLAFSGEKFATIREQVASLCWGGKAKSGFPRSQIYRVLRKIRQEKPDLLSQDADKISAEEFKKYFDRAGAAGGWSQNNLILPDKGAALSLALIAQLWDYADPLGNLGKVEGAE